MISKWLQDVVKHRGTYQCLVLRDTYLSFRGLWHRVRRRADELGALGVGENDIVGVMLGNVADYLILTAAANRLGGAVVPLDPLASSRELQRVYELVPLRAIVTRPGAAAAAKERAMLKVAEKRGGGAKIRRRLQGSLLSCTIFEGAGPAPPGTALIHVVNSVGGNLRAVYRSGENLAAEAENLAHALAITESSRIAVSLPFHHPFGLESSLALAFGYGALLHVDDDLSAMRLMRRVRDNQLDVVPLTNRLMRGLLTLPSARPLDEAPGRFLSIDGPVGKDLGKEFYRVMKTRVRSGLHLARSGLLTMDADGKSPHTTGKALPGSEIRLVTDKGTKAAKSKEGWLFARGPGVAERVVAQPDAEPELPDGLTIPVRGKGLPWHSCSVRGKLDPKGNLIPAASEEDVVRIEGTFISLEEIRQVLMGHPAVRDASVFLHAPRTGERNKSAVAALEDRELVAEVSLKKDVSPTKLLEYCGKNLSPLKIPSEVTVAK